jgi:hypothetical protein
MRDGRAVNHAWTDVGQTARLRALRCLRQISQETAMSTPFQISLAPDQLWQAINPMTFYQQGAQFGLINIDLGDTRNPTLNERSSTGSEATGDRLAVSTTHWKWF